MNHIKRNFFVLALGLLLGTAALFICGTESRADNAEANDFYIVHSAECTCDNNNVYDTVILGSTHTYTIQMHAGLTFEDAIWMCEPFQSTIYTTNGENADITFNTIGAHPILVTVTDSENHEYTDTLSINVVTEKFEDAYLNICAKKDLPSPFCLNSGCFPRHIPMEHSRQSRKKTNGIHHPSNP